MNNSKLEVNVPLPEIIKIITESEAKQINITMNNNINIKTNEQKGNNTALIGNNNFISIVNKKTYWYGVGSGILISIIINLLSSFLYSYIIK